MSLIIFPASTAQALSLTSRVARFMAQLVSFSHERLQRFGKEAAERAKRKEKFPQSAVLTCEYLGVPSEKDASMQHAQPLLTQASLSSGA